MKVQAYLSKFTPDCVVVCVTGAGYVSMQGEAEGTISVPDALALIDRLTEVINLLASANTTNEGAING